MKKHLLILSALLASQLASHAQAAEYLVKYRSNLATMGLNGNGMSTMGLGGYKMQVLDQHPAGQLLKVDISENNKIETLVNLYSNANIEYVVPNAKVYAFTVPVEASSNKSLKSQWAMTKIQAEKAWQRAGNRGSRNVLVAVIDTGADYNHKNLAPNMVPGYDFAKNDSDPMDETSSRNPGHGTHCAGVIGATGLVDGGIVGISPELSIMPIRFLGNNGSGDLNDGIKAIDYAIEKRVQVISASWGARITREEAKPMIEAVERAEKAGIVFVVAASNEGQNNDGADVYPAKAGTSNTIAVAASSSNDSKPRWSNFGKATVHLAAPGDGIMSTLPNNKYGNLSGTSMATPLVAGLVALIKAQDPDLSPLEIRSLLQASGSKVKIQTACDCRIDAFQAIDMIKSQKMFVSPQAGTFAKGEKVTFNGVYGAAPYTFQTSNAKVASIDDHGELTALADGETTVMVKDSKGQTATSYKIYVAGAKGFVGGNESTAQENSGECPLGDQKSCDEICQFQPDLLFCKH